MENNDPQGVPLIDANAAAKRLVAGMSPFCKIWMGSHDPIIAVAGSIRRRKPFVKDIEIVCVPAWKEQGDPSDLFGTARFSTNTLYRDWAVPAQRDGFIRWIKPGTSDLVDWELKPEGKYWRGLLPSLRLCGGHFPDQPCKVDIFIATPENFGLQYLLRTGSAEFSKEIVTHALRVGFKVEGGKLWDSRLRNRVTKHGNLVAIAEHTEVETPREADVFRALNLAWVEPCDRTGAGAVRSGWKGTPA